MTHQVRKMAHNPYAQWAAIAVAVVGGIVSVSVAFGNLATRVGKAESEIRQLQPTRELLIRIDERVERVQRDLDELKRRPQ